MKIFVFGNQDDDGDSLALQLAKMLVDRIKNVEFRIVKPNEDLPLARVKEAVIMDTVKGLRKVTLLTEKDIEKLKLSPRSTVHDWDLGWQLKYLRKLGKLKRVWIIGIPMRGKVEVERVTEIIETLR